MEGTMSTTANRREFLGQLAGTTALFGAFPLLDATSPAGMLIASRAVADEWDLSWTKRVTGKHKAVFDVPEVESGYGVWRSSLWMDQYKAVLGATDKDLNTILILRHNGIVMAMKQAFWDEYGVGKSHNVLHPLTQQPTDRNPAILGESDGVPQPFASFALDKFMARGGIVLGCNVAFDLDVVPVVKAKHNLDDAAARKRAIEGLLPGVILQPSGVFAAVRAQQTGAVYVRAS
jgi:hypothetical protein